MSLFLFITLFALQSFSSEIVGVADLHTHMFTDESFGGAWTVGTHDADDKENALPMCQWDGMSWRQRYIFNNHNYLKAYMSFNWCVPQAAKFPNWASLAHHQVWKGALKKAWQDGLKLVVISAVNNEDFCRYLGKGRRRWSCDNTTNISRQIKAFHKFDRSADWVELATDPASARATIAEGKLAVVLAIETSRLFGKMDIQEALDLYEGMGVRSFQIVHQIDNRFAASARHQRITNWYNRWFGMRGLNIFTKKVETPYGERFIVMNGNGLTEEGHELIDALIKRNLLIDLSHMSEQSIKDISMLAIKRSYPVFVSHGHIRTTMKPPLGLHEKTVSDELALKIKESGGMIGLRTGSEWQHTYEGSGVENDCHGSVKSFAQGYAYAFKELGVPVGIATDFNGFIKQAIPRFAGHCRGQHSPTGTEYDKTGLGHMGLLGPFIQDLETVGADPEPLFRSAESFIQMWEKTR